MPKGYPPSPMTAHTLRLTRACLGAALFGLSAAASCAGLGDARLQSNLGQPLRLEVTLLGEDAGKLGDECFRLVVPNSSNSGDELPMIRDAQLRVASNAGNPVLRISTRYAIQHPAFTVGVEIVCDAQMRRVYTLLSAPDVGAPAEPMTGARETPREVPPARPAERRPPARTAHPQTETAPGVDRPVANNADSAATPAAGKPRPAREAHTAGRKATAAIEARAPATSDRLVIGSGGTGEPELRSSVELGNADTNSVTPTQRDQLRREQELVLAIDDRIASQIELQDRIQKLEAAQARLQDENRRLQTMLQAQANAAPPATSLSLPKLPDWRLLLGGLLVLLLLLFLLRRWRQGRQVEEVADEAPAAEALPAGVDFEVEPLTPADIWPEEEQGPHRCVCRNATARPSPAPTGRRRRWHRPAWVRAA